MSNAAEAELAALVDALADDDELLARCPARSFLSRAPLASGYR